LTVTCPGNVTDITPPQLQTHTELLFKAGLFFIMTVGDPGVQGADVTGMQGAGVGTPIAAEVAVATAGLDSVVHMVKGIMFFMGTLSMIVAPGILVPLTTFSGVTIIELGTVPKLHIRFAPIVTSCAIQRLLSQHVVTGRPHQLSVSCNHLINLS
jgi:hypothetical protein